MLNVIRSTFFPIGFLTNGQITASWPTAGNGRVLPPFTIERRTAPGLYPQSLSRPPRLAAALASLSTRFEISFVLPSIRTYSRLLRRRTHQCVWLIKTNRKRGILRLELISNVLSLNEV